MHKNIHVYDIVKEGLNRTGAVENAGLENHEKEITGLKRHDETGEKPSGYDGLILSFLQPCYLVGHFRSCIFHRSSGR